MQHLNKRGNIYYFRKRIPTSILHLCTVKEINRPLSKDKKLALQISKYYNNLFNMIDLCMKTNQDPTRYIKKLNLQQIKQVDIYKQFLHTKQGTSTNSYREYKQQLELLQHLLPKDIKKLSYSHIDTIIKTISKLPKRNIQKYRELSLKELIKSTVPEKDRISIKSQNEYIKTLRALLKFCYERQYIDRPYTINLLSNKTTTRNQRQSLSKDDLAKLFNHKKVGKLSKVLYLSGMRLSELYKCKITTIDNVKVFDLTDTSTDLKTESSHRIIPIHNSLSEYIEDILKEITKTSDKRYSRIVSETLNTSGKTLHSLRHTFATELASKGIEESIIVELMGHSHKSMSMSRYVKGLPVQLLKDAVDKIHTP